MKTQVISKITLWACMGIGLLVFLVFLFGGSETETRVNDGHTTELTIPNFTDMLIYVMYAFILAAAVGTIINFVLSITKYRDNGLIRMFIACAASVGIVAALGLTMGWTNGIIFGIYILFVAAALLAVGGAVMGAIKK